MVMRAEDRMERAEDLGCRQENKKKAKTNQAGPWLSREIGRRLEGERQSQEGLFTTGSPGMICTPMGKSQRSRR